MDKPKFYTGYAFEEDVSKEKQELYAKQREERGFDDTELWNLDETIVQFILPRLKAFIKNKPVGYPASVESYEKWMEILDKMLYAFEMLSNYDEFIFKGQEVIKPKVKEGLELFGKYLVALWD